MQKVGLPYSSDFASGNLHGVGFFQSTLYKARRCSSADAFLTPIRNDPKLSVITAAVATKIVFHGNRAVGVEYLKDGKRQVAAASKEVILTAGSFVTPKLLMLSGIGPADQLKAHGIDIRADLPGVRQNLQDHHTAVLSTATRGVHGYYGEDRGFSLIRNALQYFGFKTGPASSTGSESVAFVNIDDPQADPDIQLYCIGMMWPGVSTREPSEGLTLIANLVKPKSRGSVRLRSANPEDDLEINLNWMSDPEDSRRMVKALRYLRRIASTVPLANVIHEEIAPGAEVESDEGLLDFIRKTTQSNYHPVGTCRMGTADDPLAVLTPDLKVKGVEGLRVFDASMMPHIISANTNATVMAVADKGVDILMGKNAPTW